MRTFTAYCVIASVLAVCAPANSAEPLPNQSKSNQPLPNPSLPIPVRVPSAAGDAFAEPTNETPARQTIKFRNATAGEITVSLQADQKAEPTTSRCTPGGVASFTITSDGPFEVTFQTGGQRFSRSRLDLQAIRRRMRGDTTSIHAMADLETDIDAVENKKVTSTLGAMYVTFPANVPGGVLQALFPNTPEYRAVPESAPPAFPSPRGEIKSPSANPPEARSPQPKTP